MSGHRSDDAVVVAKPGPRSHAPARDGQEVDLPERADRQRGTAHQHLAVDTVPVTRCCSANHESRSERRYTTRRPTLKLVGPVPRWRQYRNVATGARNK